MLSSFRSRPLLARLHATVAAGRRRRSVRVSPAWKTLVQKRGAGGGHCGCADESLIRGVDRGEIVSVTGSEICVQQTSKREHEPSVPTFATRSLIGSLMRVVRLHKR